MSLAWRDRARCAGQPVEIFFPEQSIGKRRIDQVLAALCVPCPVRADCLADDLRRSTTLRHGIRGGVLWQAAGKTYDPHGFLPNETAPGVSTQSCVGASSLGLDDDGPGAGNTEAVRHPSETTGRGLA